MQEYVWIVKTCIILLSLVQQAAGWHIHEPCTSMTDTIYHPMLDYDKN